LIWGVAIAPSVRIRASAFYEVAGAEVFVSKSVVVSCERSTALGAENCIDYVRRATIALFAVDCFEFLTCSSI